MRFGIVVLLIITLFLGYCVQVNYPAYAARNSLESSKDLRLLSDDCVALLKAHPEKIRFQLGEDEALLPKQLVALKPVFVYADFDGLHADWGERPNAHFGLSCRRDGSIWLHGGIAKTHCIYHDPAKPEPPW